MRVTPQGRIIAEEIMRVNARQNAGRPHVSGTRLAKIMRARGIKKHDVGRVLRCSDATVYNYLTRRYPIPPMMLAALCDRLDMDPEDLVDDDGFLLEEQEEATAEG